jgi:predicted Zn-dependent protease with MMP-like domain
MNEQRIIMNFSVPPSLEDLEVMASSILESLPDEILEFCDGLAVRVDDLADEAVEEEFDLDDPFDLIALYRSGKEISPGVEKRTANDDDVLVIYRRPLLDLWCETGEDLNVLFRQVIIEELGRHFDFADDEIDELAGRHFQGML